MAKMFLGQTGLSYLIGRIWQHVASAVGGKADTTSIGNGTLTITQDGVTVATFTANQSGNTTAALATGGSGSSTPGLPERFTPYLYDDGGSYDYSYSGTYKHFRVDNPNGIQDVTADLNAGGFCVVTNNGSADIYVYYGQGNGKMYPSLASNNQANTEWGTRGYYLLRAYRTAVFMCTSYGAFLLSEAGPEAGA